VRPASLGEDSNPQPTIAEVRSRVAAARARQAHRAHRLDLSASVNAWLTSDELDRVLPPGCLARRLVHENTGQTGPNLAELDRVLRVAVTLADLEGVEEVDEHHLAEATELADPDGLGLMRPLAP